MQPPTWEPDTLFLLDPVDEARVLAAGGRLSEEYTDYFSPGTAKAGLVPGPFDRLGVAHPGGLVFPVDGLLPIDQFTVSFWLRGRATTELLRFGRHLVVALAGDELTATWLPAGLRVRVRLAGADADAGGWQPCSVTWEDGSLTLRSGDAAATAIGTVAPCGPVSGNDGGLVVLGGNDPDQPHDAAVAEVHVRRFARTGARGPTIAVDVRTPGEPFRRDTLGLLALYTGFRLHEDGRDPDVGTAIRDAQFRAVAEAGVPVVRIGGVVSATRIGADGSYDFSVLDEKLDLLHRLGARFHVTLDYNHPLTGAHNEPPKDPARWAELASNVFAHLRATYRVVSVSLWNEPDIEDYWSGTREEFFALWRVVQRRFLRDHPDMPLATADWAFAENCIAHLEDIAEAGLSVSAACMHTYLQDLDTAGADVRAIRAAADRLGFARLPIRIPEWGMDILRNQERYSNSRSVANAWPNRLRTMPAAAYCLAFLHEVLSADDHVDLATLSSIGSVDLGYLPPSAYTIADEALLSSDDPPQPLPTFAAMSLLWRLSGHRVEATSNWPGVRALATTDGEQGITTVVYGSYRPWQATDRMRLDFTWRGLPERFTWQQCRIDGGRVALVRQGDERDLTAAGAEVGVLDVGAFVIAYMQE